MQKLKKGASYFTLQGKAKVNKGTFGINVFSEAKAWRYNKMFLGVDCGNDCENVVYAELMGGYSEKRDNVIYVHGKKLNDKGREIDDYDNRFEIDFRNRDNQEIINSIGERCFLKVTIEQDIEGKPITRKFLSSYDAIAYLSEHLTDDMEITVKGNLKYSIYQDNIQVKKEINSVYLTSDKAKKEKNKAEFVQSILLDKDSIKQADKENSVIPLEVRVLDYDKRVKGNIPFPITLEMAYDKNNEEELHRKAKILLKILKPKDNITEAEVIGEFVESSQLIDIEDCNISDDVRLLMQEGMVREFSIKQKAVGNNKKLRRMMLITPNIRVVTKESGEFSTETAVTHNKYTEEDLIVKIPETEDTVKTESDDDKADLINQLGL